MEKNYVRLSVRVNNDLKYEVVHYGASAFSLLSRVTDLCKDFNVMFGDTVYLGIEYGSC